MGRRRDGRRGQKGNYKKGSGRVGTWKGGKWERKRRCWRIYGREIIGLNRGSRLGAVRSGGKENI